MTTRFKNAIDALVKAFLNGTLKKGKCTACAVGNIVAYCHGVKVDPDDDGFGENDITIEGAWEKHSNWRLIDHKFFDDHEILRGLKIIEKTGYSAEELLLIEEAFEGNTIHIGWLSTEREIMQDQHKGLCAVVDVLCEIEGIQDPTEYKELFAYA